MSTLSNEWSSQFSGDPPESLNHVIDSVNSLVDSLPTPTSKLGEASYPIPDRARIISIFGGRGSGKSTVLQLAARTLAKRDDCLVLRTIDPEAFAPGDSLGGWFFAELDRRFSEKDRAHDIKSDSRSLGQLIEELRRAQTTRGSAYVKGLESRGLGFDDFVRDAVKVPAHGVRATDRVTKLLDALADARGQDGLRVVIPVDDADLAPDLLPGIVSDAQLLSASPRVVMLFAADKSTLEQSLQLAYLSTHGSGVSTAFEFDLLRPADVRRSVARQLVKHFPRGLRVELPALTIEQRLNFRPLVSESVSLLEALQRLKVPFENPERTLADLFVLRDNNGAQLAISPYAHSLSDNMRDIRQLHEAIVAIDPNGLDSTRRAVWTILRHGLDAIEPELPPELRGAIAAIGTDEEPLLSFDFRGISWGKTIAGGVKAFDSALVDSQNDKSGDRRSELAEVADDAADIELPPHLEDQPISKFVLLRQLSTQYATMSDVEDDDEGESDSRKQSELPVQFTYLTQLAWEMIQREDGEHSLLRSDGSLGRLVMLTGQNWSNLALGSLSGPSWRYWTIPDWEHGSDVLLCQHGWDCLVDAMRGVEDPPQTGAWLEFALLVHLSLVVGVQLDRAVPEWVAKLDHSELLSYRDPEVWSRRRSSLQSELTNELERAFEAASGGPTVRDSDFRSWVERLLPLSASPLLTTPLLASWLLDLWRKLIPKEARSQAGAVIARLANEHIATEMSEGDIMLLAQLDPSDLDLVDRAERLWKTRRMVRERRASEQRQVIAALRKGQIDDALVSPLQSSGATPDVLTGLLAAGLAPEDLARIVEAFPPAAIDRAASNDARDEQPNQP